MKKLLVTMMALFALFACSDDENDIKQELNVEPANLSFTALGGMQEFTVTTTLDAYEVSGETEWCRFTKTDNQVTVEVDPLLEEQPRNAKLTVKAGALSKEVNVHQKASEADLSADKSEVKLNIFGQTVKVEILAEDTTWTAEPSENAWCSVEKDSCYLLISAGEYTQEGKTRDAAIIVTFEDAVMNIPVSQAGGSTAHGSPFYGPDGIPVGVIVKTSDTTKYVLSLKQEDMKFFADGTSDNAEELNTNVRADVYDGRICMEKIKAIQGWREKYLTAAYCAELEEETQIEGWYLASPYESVWEYIGKNMDEVNGYMEVLGGEKVNDPSSYEGDGRFWYYWTHVNSYQIVEEEGKEPVIYPATSVATWGMRGEYYDPENKERRPSWQGFKRLNGEAWPVLRIDLVK